MNKALIFTDTNTITRRRAAIDSQVTHRSNAAIVVLFALMSWSVCRLENGTEIHRRDFRDQVLRSLSPFKTALNPIVWTQVEPQRLQVSGGLQVSAVSGNGRQEDCRSVPFLAIGVRRTASLCPSVRCCLVKTAAVSQITNVTSKGYVS